VVLHATRVFGSEERHTEHGGRDSQAVGPKTAFHWYLSLTQPPTVRIHGSAASEREKEGGRGREKDRPTYITIIQHTHKNLEDLKTAQDRHAVELCERSRRERTSEVIRLVGKRVGTLCETKGLSRVTCLLPLVKGAATRFQLGKLSGIRRNAESNSRTYNANEFNVRSRWALSNSTTRKRQREKRYR